MELKKNVSAQTNPIIKNDSPFTIKVHLLLFRYISRRERANNWSGLSWFIQSPRFEPRAACAPPRNVAQ